MRTFGIALLLLFILPAKSYSQNNSLSEIQLGTDYPIICAEVILEGLKDPGEKAIAQGLIGLGYLSRGDTVQALHGYNTFLSESTYIESKFLRYHNVLTFTNTFRACLDKSELEKTYQNVLQDSAGIGIRNKIELALLAIHADNYSGAIELLNEASMARSKFYRMNGGELYWFFSRELDEAIATGVEKIVENSEFKTEKDYSKALNLVEEFNLIDPLRNSFKHHFRKVEDVILASAENVSLDFTFEMSELYLSKLGQRDVYIQLMENAIGEGDTIAVKSIYSKLESLMDDNSSYLLIDLSYIDVLLKAEMYEEVKTIGDTTHYYNFETPIYAALSEAYYAKGENERAQFYLNHLLNTIDSTNYASDIVDRLIAVAAVMWGHDDQKALEIMDEAKKTLVTYVSDYSRDYATRDMVTVYAEWGEYKRAVDFTRKLSNYGPSSPRSALLRDVYEIAFENGDSIEGFEVLNIAMNEIETIDHFAQRSAFLEYGATKYAQIGEYDKSIEIGKRFKRNAYQSIDDYIRAFFVAYEETEGTLVPSSYYVDFIEMLNCGKRFMDNHDAYKFLITTYYASNFQNDAIDFEMKMETAINQYNLKEEFKDWKGDDRVDVLFSQENLRYYLYEQSGNMSKVNELIEIGKKRCTNRRYGLSDIEALMRIERKYYKWSFFI